MSHLRSRRAPFALLFKSLVVAVTFSFVFAGCGKSAGEDTAETESFRRSQADIIQGCGNRRSSRAGSNWTPRLYAQRCQQGYLRWQLGNNAAPSPSSTPSGSVVMALDDPSATRSHQAFCASVQSMYNNTGGERAKRALLIGALQDSLGRNPTESGLRTKLSELLHCPATFVQGGLSFVINETNDSGTCRAGGDAGDCEEASRSGDLNDL